MTNEQMVSRALSSNAWTTAGTGTSSVNPDIWVRQIMEFMKAKLVVAPLGRVYNDLLGSAGDSLIVPFNAEITAAAVAETAAITPSAISYTSVTFTPSEYAVAVAITRKQRDRQLNDVMMEKTRDMGYALAKLKDKLAITTLVSGASNSIVANGVAVSAVTTSDTLDTDDIADALKELRIDEHEGRYLVIHPKQENSLLKLSDFIDASVYGGREVVMNGEIGKYLGIRVLVSTQVQRNATTSTAYDALLMDDDVFGIAYKRNVTFDADYVVLQREFQLAAVEDYDIQVLRGAGICKITAYGG